MRTLKVEVIIPGILEETLEFKFQPYIDKDKDATEIRELRDIYDRATKTMDSLITNALKKKYHDIDIHQSDIDSTYLVEGTIKKGLTIRLKLLVPKLMISESYKFNVWIEQDKSDDQLQKALKIIGDVHPGKTYSVSYQTKELALKKSRITKEPTPDHLEYIVKKTVLTITIPTRSYEDMVNLNRWQANKDMNFKSQEIKGEMKTLNSSGTLIKSLSTGKMYLKLWFNPGDVNRDTVYFNKNGEELAKEEVCKLRDEYFKLPTDNKNEGDEERVQVLMISVDNVKNIVELVKEKTA